MSNYSRSTNFYRKKKRLVYEKGSIIDEEYDIINIKWIASLLSDLVKNKILRNPFLKKIFSEILYLSKSLNTYAIHLIFMISYSSSIIDPFSYTNLFFLR